jgi:cobalt-precorrin-5B (C1)-methyltransferase
MTKVAQGFKNTHNKYGSIDFQEVREWLEESLHVSLQEQEFRTLKGVLEVLDKEYHPSFVKLLTQKATQQLQQWLRELSVEVESIEVITLPQKISFVCYN